MLVLYLSIIDDENHKRKFEEIYLSYRKQMLIVARSVVHQDADVEDVVHEVFLNIATRYMETVSGIKEEKVLRNYLLIATKRTALNWLRKYKHIIYVEPEAELDYIVPEISDDKFVEHICERIEYEQVIQAIARLEEKYKWVMYYHFVMEIPIPKVAEMLQQSVATTKKQLVRGKKKLLTLLEMRGEESNVNDERRI
ncbi:MAG: sigma-70 family RNA polymerase sigma factor [Agathobacter sp.]|nr:sigma-70 family RNA polymerase sigma factor [Agathobacter sp.]